MTRRLLSITLAVALLGCHGGAREDDAETAVRAPVSTATVRRDSMAEQVEILGELRPSPGHAASLTSPVAGVILETAVQAGDAVAPGTLLLRLDAPELAAAAASSAAAADAAERDASRQRGLLDEGVASRRTVEEKEAAARSARADATAAAAQLARTAIHSPIKGHVQRVAAQVGERVEAGALLVEVVDRSSLDLTGAVPASALPRIHPGQTALISVEGQAAQFAGVVHAVAPALDSASHSGTVIVRLRNPGALPAGIGARAQVRVGTLRNAILIPDSAIVVVGDSEATFVVGADSVAHRRSLVVLARHAGWTAVRGDLEAGNLVVTTGAWGLVDGMHVVVSKAIEDK